eukprot:4710726-Pleurochrysis_carterae.AAC.4
MRTSDNRTTNLYVHTGGMGRIECTSAEKERSRAVCIFLIDRKRHQLRASVEYTHGPEANTNTGRQPAGSVGCFTMAPRSASFRCAALFTAPSPACRRAAPAATAPLAR